MKKNLFYSLVAAGLLFGASGAYAAENEKIAVVNIQLIMRDSTAAKSVREQLESKQKSFQTDITKRQDTLQKEQQELGKQQSVLSKDAFESKSRAFGLKVTEAQKEVESKKALLNTAFDRSLNDIQKVVTEIIGDLSKEKNFEIAIPTSQILYADSKLDISSEVLERLNKKLPTLDVKFDAPAEAKSDKKSAKGK